MTVKVRTVLNNLQLPRLRDLCRQRSLQAAGNKGELQERLSRSFRGDAKQLFDLLTREEMIVALESICFELDGVDGPGVLSYLGQSRKEDLSTIGKRVFGDNWDPKSKEDTPAPPGCPVRISWEERDSPPEAWKTLCSTRYSGIGLTKLCYQSLGRDLRGVKALSIASAYYDVRFFEELLLGEPEGFEKLKSVRIMVSGLAGARLRDQLNDLTGLRDALARRYGQVEIRLVFAPKMSIFHAKLFLGRKHGSRVALVGSANATQAAMTENEEILLRLEAGTEALEAYFDHVWSKAKTLEDAAEREKARTLVNFFRTGRMYFRTSTSFQLSVNPFSPLVRNLPRDERALLTNVRLRHSEPKAGVGPFDLRAALGLTEEVDEEERVDEQKHKASIKPFAVETSLGYWVPGALTAALDAKLDVASEAKQGRIKRFKKALDSVDDATLHSRYQEYLDDGRARLEVLFSFGEVLRELWMDPFASHDSFLKRLARLRSNLNNAKYLERLRRPFSGSVMPEIWDDLAAYGEFKDSFFEYVAYVGGLPTKSAVPRAILEKAGCPDGASAEDVAAGLDAYLKRDGWHYEQDWPPKHTAET